MTQTPQQMSQEAYDWWHAIHDLGGQVVPGYLLTRWWRRMRAAECRLSRVMGRTWRVGDDF